MSTHPIDGRSRNLLIAGLALASTTGAILSLACGQPDERPKVSVADVREEAREAGAAASDYMKQQLAELEARFDQAARQAEDEIVDARQEAEELPEETRAGLRTAIDRAEQARERASRELDELRRAGQARWETARGRFVEALDELDEARREVTAAIAGETTAG